MKITEVEPILLSIGEPGEYLEEIWPRSICLVRIHTDSGLTGLGESYLGVFAPEVAASLVRTFGEMLIGCDPMNVEGLNQIARASTVFWARGGAAASAFSGIDCALLDLAGKAYGVPVYVLLGGPVRERQLTYASCGPGLWPVQRMVERVAEQAALGFVAAKLNIGYPERGPAETLGELIEEEQTKLRALRQELGQGFGLMLDCCQGTCTPAWPAKTALQVANALEEFGLTWLEEPCGFDDWQSWALVRARTPTPIAGGEAAAGLSEVDVLLRSEALDILQPDAAFSGGITLCRQVLTLASQYSKQVALHCYGTAAAMAANIHLAFASAGCAYVEFPILAHPLREILWVESPLVESGYINPPKAPGLGIKFDEDLIDRFPYRPKTGFQGTYTLGPRRP